ncbi:cyclopropane-fatty-acyl-phospholipid synthase family protein [Streptomyces sp. NPDC050659]|uniref:cyclopropane-fatty-acyl-phospholipid synthase family protein n=1 Tax=Streptomyces sp. NPDC050659 TaxID=3157215 RepID=UPI00341A2142
MSGAPDTSLAAGPARTADTGRWPDVAAVPACSAARTAVARRVVRHALNGLPLRVSLGAGEQLGEGGPLLEVRDPDTFLRRIATNGLIGFGESYMAYEWDADDLVGALTVLAGHAATLVPSPLQRLRALWAPRQPGALRNTPSGARTNIQHHYDLSNELFALFLDPSLSYSSALFDRTPATWADLTPGQYRKIDRVLDLCGVGPGTRLLEIGTGWGTLAIRAADRGASVHSVTLSAEQCDLARRRVRAGGHEGRVRVDLCDYRQVRGSYDAIASVEMIEAVGPEYWPTFFRALDTLLAPGGRVALQAITMPHDRMLASRSTYTWVQKYIFPGGMLPSVRAIEENVRSHTRLRVTACDGFGEHYAQTLRLWRERFAQQADAVEGLGFDDTFRRMWTFYLAYSEAGFRSRYLDVHQIQLTDQGEPS